MLRQGEREEGGGAGDGERDEAREGEGKEGDGSRPGSATAAIFHGADIRFRSTIAAKHKQKWRTRGEDEGEGRDDEGGGGDGRYGAKEENGKDGNQVP